MPVVTGSAIAKAYGIDPALAEEIVRVAGRVGIPNPAMLANVIAFETGGTFSPSIAHSSSNATGLIQFTASTAAELGTSLAALRNMSALQQMEYVERYFNLPRVRQGCPETGGKAPIRGCGLSNIPYRNQLDVYAAVFNVPNRRDVGMRLTGLASAWNVAQSGYEYEGWARNWLKGRYGPNFPYLNPTGRIIPAAVAGSIGTLMLGGGFLWWLTLRKEGK